MSNQPPTSPYVCQRCSPSSMRSFNRHEERIAKDFAGILKADAVLALIGEVLRLVPFETDSAHYIIIITNLTLCNMPHPAAKLSHFCAHVSWEFDEHPF